MAGVEDPSERGRSRWRAVLRRLPLIGTLIGVVLAVWLVAINDLTAIGTAFARIGPLGLMAVVLVRLVIVLLCGIAWARILDRLSEVPASPFVVLRFVREGINTLLPVASVGGDVVGGRLLTFWRVPGPYAAASILVDLLIQAVTLVIFALLGVALLMQVEGEAAATLASWVLQALLVMVLVLALFFGFQRSGVVRRLARIASDLGRRFVRDEARGEDIDDGKAAQGDLQDAIDLVWGKSRRWPLAQSILIHFAAWLLGAIEIWIALSFIGVEGIGLPEAIVIEALTQAMKTAAFPVPGGLGVQEGSFILVGGLFGVDPGTALALSLVKRVPDVVIGIPALMLWQSLEARRASVMKPGSP
ncbi:MAG: flippase-like domain-containing protein [Methylobacterium sp.]|uniref:flippase-like domain-containing protein n=1 Tax=Methylobacterium sp. TaxID=409 RepID=UPI0025D769C7|nr:flippase-like domain-containing protein [Methylobacterium sp.]MBX9930698.1 flippase-like domain-containing protein [Methylobacterium sp.]